MSETFHVDALMRLPLMWQPVPLAGVAAAEVADPVGQVDLAPTFCAIAGIEPAEWMQGAALLVHDGEPGRERMLCGPEMAGRDGADRATLIAALESATRFAAWDNLRVDHRLSVPQARAAVRTTVESAARARGL